MIFFQQNLYYLRSKKKMTLAVIANELGFSASQWSNYEQGISFPKFLDLIKIARYFELTETTLIHTDLESKSIEITEQSEKDKESIILLQNKIIQMQEDKIKELQLNLDNLKKTKAK